MSDSDEFGSAKDEEHKESEGEEVASSLASSDDVPLKKKSLKKSSPKKKTKPKKTKTKSKASKNKAIPEKKSPKIKAKQSTVSFDLVPTRSVEKDPLESTDEEEYEVESIVGHREYNGKLVYKIRWKGYEAVHDTWEDFTSLSCPDLLEAYNTKHKVVIPSSIKKAKLRGRPKGSQKKAKKPRRSSVSDEEDESEESNLCDDHNSDDVEGEDGDEYEVEKIVETRFKRDGKREFLVHWKKWSSNYDTWEPEENLNCPELINKFMEKVENAKNSNQKDLRVKRKHTDRFTLNTNDSGRRLSRRNNNKQRVSYFDAEGGEDE